MLIGVILGFTAGFSVVLGAPPALIMAVVIAGGALGLWAIFLITAPEPMIAVQEDPFTLRKVVRGTAVVGLIGGVLSQSAHFGGPVPGWALLGGLVLSLAGIAAMFGEFVYLRRFARRMPNDKLARSTTTVMWGYVTMYAAMIVLGATAALAGFAMVMAPATPVPSGLSGGWLATIGILGCGFFIGMLVFGIWYIVLLFQYLNAFKRQAAAARIIYAADISPGNPTP